MAGESDVLPDAERLEAARAAFPVLQEVAYLNTGYTGPVPRPVLEGVVAEAEREMKKGPATPGEIEARRQRMAQLRAQVAGLIGARPEEVALTRSTTEGINIALWGLPWREGDRVVTTSLEHEGVRVPLWTLERRLGVQVDHVDVGMGRPGETLEAMDRALRQPARAVVVSHVAYTTGAVLPVGEIIEMAHQRGALVIVDGAQSVGAIPVDAASLKADFYALPAQKWLCGPEGLGALYVPDRHWEMLQPTYGGFDSVQPPGRDPAPLAVATGARRYEVGNLYRPAVAGFGAGLAWLGGLGWEWIFPRIRHLSLRASQLLGDLPGCDLVLDGADQHGLVSLAIPNVHPRTAAERLAARGLIVRWVRRPLALRVSTGFFNSEEELARLRDALAEVLEERVTP